MLETSEDTLSPVLETIFVLCGVGDGSWFTTDLASALITALVDVWPRNIKAHYLFMRAGLLIQSYLIDPIFLSILNDSIAIAKVSGV